MPDKEIAHKEKQELKADGELTKEGLYFTPDVDIFENEESIVLIADMPGVPSKGVDIHLEDSELRLIGHVAPPSDAQPIMTEYRIGDYQRTFTLSNIIDQGKIEAIMKEGVLKVTLPKAESAKPKKIAIKTE